MRVVWVLLLVSCALLRPMAGLAQVDPAAAVTISLPGTTFAKGAPMRMAAGCSKL